MNVSTETILTSSLGFGLESASPCQRAICRVLDGEPLAEHADDPEVVRLVGGPEALAELPSERGVAPTIALVLAAIRCAKTMTAAAAATRMTQTVDVSGLKHGEVPRVSIVSLKLDTSAVAFSQLVGAWHASSLLRPLIIGEPTADTLTVRHPSGRPIEIACVAGARAGNGLVARWSAGVIFDEAPRMNGRADGVVNLEEGVEAVIGRLLPGAQILEIGSPHAPSGPCYDQASEHFGKPTENLVVLRGTGPMLNPTWWTPKRCAQLEERNPIAYRTDVLGEFADPESGLLSPVSIRQNEREDQLELLPEDDHVYAAGIDMSEGLASGNPSTLVIVEAFKAKEDGHPFFRVALAREWRGERPELILSQMADCCDRFGVEEARTDQYAGASNADLAARFGLKLKVVPWTAALKLEEFQSVATLIHADRIELPPHRQFRRDLLAVKKRVTQTGMTIVLPKTSDGRHCDFAPAFVAAVHAAQRAHKQEPLDMTLFTSRIPPNGWSGAVR